MFSSSTIKRMVLLFDTFTFHLVLSYILITQMYLTLRSSDFLFANYYHSSRVKIIAGPE